MAEEAGEEERGDEFSAFFDLLQWDDEEVGDVDEEVQYARCHECGGGGCFEGADGVDDLVDDVVGVLEASVRVKDFEEGG